MAQKEFLIDINLNHNQLLNATLQNLSVAPSTASLKSGFIYWNTTDKKPYIWTGSSWLDLSLVYQHPLYPGNFVPSDSLSGAKIISRIKVENGHVTDIETRDLSAQEIGAAKETHTHLYSEISSLPGNTILGNNNPGIGPAKALTLNDLLIFLGIGYGSAAILNAQTDTTQRTWSAKDLSDWVGSKIDSYIVAVNLTLGTRTSIDLKINNDAGSGVTLPQANNTEAGLMSSTDKSKLDNIESGANKYVHPDISSNNEFSTALLSGLKILSKITINAQGHVTEVLGRNLTAADLALVLINDSISNGTNQTWSSSKINTEIQNAVNAMGTGALIYQGAFTPTTSTSSPVPTTAAQIKKGFTWVFSGVNDFNWNGSKLSSGDMLISLVNTPDSSNPSHWNIVNKNIPEILQATEFVAGIALIASDADVAAGLDDTKIVTSKKLKTILDKKTGHYTLNIGNGTLTSFTLSHNLGTQGVNVTVKRISTQKQVEVDWSTPSINTLTINFNNPPTTNEFVVDIFK